MSHNVVKAATTCHRTIQIYKDLLDSYVSDFYIENHWSKKLSESWKTFLASLTFEQLGVLLSYHQPSMSALVPLTIMCLQKIVQNFSVTRAQVPITSTAVPPETELFNKYIWKNVKMKKKHEIEIMSRVCYDMGLKSKCFNIVDVGSGLGHLSRMLAYKYGFNICTFEANEKLIRAAQELDNKFEQILANKNIPHFNKQKPVHTNKRIDETLSSREFEKLITQAFNIENNKDFKVGITGLHPCGNLGSTLLKLFKNSSMVVFINIVSCCYMKLSLEPSGICGFPLSTFYKKQKYKLDYLTCEVACHAIERFTLNLGMGNCTNLKVHAYRAALESLIDKTDKTLRHCAVGNVKYTEGLRFKDYCEKALQKYDLVFTTEELEYYEGIIERTWRDIVKFYSVRLFLAPLVESVILYDRLLYLSEGGFYCNLISAFNSKISARNQVLIAHKKK
ncbi:methyltransferase-like protein 25B [Euwallacea fornicatus]|uniref:methyltransferase-like protein 25B n=1 Tax=Euwallacea fornicatus TaxID=995702 RepID=UPI00338EDED2